jgi:hypothetical protein
MCQPTTPIPHTPILPPHARTHARRDEGAAIAEELPVAADLGLFHVDCSALKARVQAGKGGKGGGGGGA